MIHTWVQYITSNSTFNWLALVRFGDFLYSISYSEILSKNKHFISTSRCYINYRTENKYY